MGVVIEKSGKCIKENEAYDYVGGYCLALDMTDAELMVSKKTNFKIKIASGIFKQVNYLFS